MIPNNFILFVIASVNSLVIAAISHFHQVTIKKSDYPNGVFRFIGDDNVSIKSPSPGGTELAFTLERFGGNRLPVTVRWRIERTEPFISPTTR